MINTTLILTATLASPPPATITRSTPEFEPDRAEVTIHYDGLEIQAFEDDELVGVLLMTTDAEGLQIDASFVDGYVDGVMPSSPGSRPLAQCVALPSHFRTPCLQPWPV